VAYKAEIDVSVKNLNQVTDLETKLSSISRNVNALNKGTGGGRRGGGGGSAKSELSEEQKLLQLQNKRLIIQNKGLGVESKNLDLKLKGTKLAEAANNLSQVENLTEQDNLDLAKNKILLADKEIKQTQLRLKEERGITTEVEKRAKFLKGAPTGFTAAQFGPQMAPTKGAGQAAMSIDTITKQSEKRLRIELKLRELEAKGVNTDKLRVKMGELVDAQNRKEFGTIKRINREIGRSIAKEESKLKLLQLQNKERLQANKLTVQESTAQGPFTRLSDRQSRDAGGKRTFMNNPLVSGLAKIPGINPTRGFDFGSALISGGFPLLFGQGPGVAAAGALGGGIGGMFGQMGGFAGGIAATAAVQAIQNVINGIGELGQAMNRLNPNISAMSQAMGIAGTIEEKRLQLIEKNQGKQAAFNAALEMLGEKIGADKAEELRKFGETFQELGNRVTLFFTKVQAAVAKLLNQATEKVQETFIKPGEARKFIRENPDNPAFSAVNQKIEGIQNRKVRGAAATKQKTRDLNAAKAERLEIAKKLLLEEKSVEKKKNLNDLITDGLSGLDKENKLNEAIIAGKEKEFLIEQASRTLAEEMGQDFDKLEKAERDRITSAVENNRQLKEQAKNAKAVRDAFESINQSIGTDIKDGIAGLIKGTSTLSDLLNNVANKFLDVALNQALFGDVLGAGGKKGGGILGFLTGGLLANGGRAAGGKSFIVGEKGPELFVPKSSGTVVPNDKLKGGGSTSVVVNVDASGSDVQGDDAGGQELGTLIAVAVQGELVKQQRPGGLLNR